MSRDRVIGLIRDRKNFLVTCHRRPDGDALGSALGLAAILRALDKSVVVYHPEELPLSLQFLVEPDDVVRSLPASAAFDATFVTDTAAAVLLPDPFPSPDVTGTVVVIDHHVASSPVGDVVLRDVDACATGVVIWSLLDELGLSSPPAAAALPLYTSICADTGGFRYPNTDAKTLRMAAALLDAGADPWLAAYNLFEGWPEERVGLLREVLGGLTRHVDDKVAVLRVTRAMMHATGATDEMVDGLVNYGRRIRGVEIAVLLWERPSRKVAGKTIPVTKVSMRSKGDADVAEIAISLGGGGHRVAAAAEVDGTLDEIVTRVISEAGRAVEGL